ncbi:hypothetical protein MMC22_000991 [Lobaria immixta]|nr:hypothetical protein [Lobaria immixta]
MDQLSAELISIVCSFLNLRDVGHLRCASRFYANVGRPFMFRHLHLIFTPDSFERLHAISSDPTLAPYVTSLYYEADTLPIYRSFRNWERHLVEPAILSEMESMKLRDPDSSGERVLRAYQPKLTKSTKRSRLQLLTAYEKYVNYLEQQEAMREDDYYAGKIADAMFHLPNLSEIVLSLDRWAGGPSKAIENAYSDSHVIPYGHNSWRPIGVPQMLSLLQGSARTEMKLKSLCGGILDWRFFMQSDAVWEELHKAVQGLQELKLEFLTSMREPLEFLTSFEEPWGLTGKSKDTYHHYYYSTEEEIDCAEYLTNGRLLEFLAAAPNLRLLDLRFDRNDADWLSGSPAELRDAVGKHRWEFLADVTLSVLDSRAEDLVDFCEIHATTLQRLVLNNIQLLQGSWPSTFQEMRRLLHLKQVRICGNLRAYDLDEDWLFAAMESSETTMSGVVQEYLLQGGDGPLLDLSNFESLIDPVLITMDIYR